jgi:hypothetical protein
VALVEPSPLLLWTFVGLLYQPWMTGNDDDDCGAISRMNELQVEPRYLELPLYPPQNPEPKSGSPRCEAGE